VKVSHLHSNQQRLTAQPHAQARVHHRRARRRGAAAGRARGRLARGSADDDEVWPRPRQPGPPRNLHRRRLRRRRRQV